jgi:opacity protein-like surface antigen
MKEIIKGTFVLTALVLAISTVTAQGEYYRFEGYGGYAYMNTDRGFDVDEFDDDFDEFPTNKVDAHGFNGSFTYNFSRYVGAKFDMTFHSSDEEFDSILSINPPPPNQVIQRFRISQSTNQFMGGIQIKDNSRDGAVFKPWAHALIGVADQNYSIDQSDGNRLLDMDSTDLALKFGGGIDIKVHKNIDIRAIGFDWNPINRGDFETIGRFGTINGGYQNNWLINFGIVIH